MAWQFIGVSSVVEVTAAPHALVTTGIAGTLQAGDLLIACIGSRIASTTSITLPTGGAWTLVAEQKNNNILSTGSALPSGLMAYCIRGASNPNLTFTHPTAPSVALGRIVAYRDVNQGSPKDTQTAFQTATSITAVSGAGLTTTLANDLIVAMACGGQEAAWSAFNATSPAGASGATSTAAPTTAWLERADSLTTTGVDTSLAIFDAIKAAAGATGNLTATASIAAGHVVIAGAFKIAGIADAWNVSDKAANVTLSDSDKTATISANNQGVRSTQARLHEAAGKYYAEFLCTTLEDECSYGIFPLTSALTSVSTGSLGCLIDLEGVVRRDGSATGDDIGAAYVNGDVVCIAYDTALQRMWFRKNNGSWNGNPAANPANSGDLLYTNLASFTAVNYALFHFTGTGLGVPSVTTLRTELAEFTYAVPSGFTSWMGETPAVTTSRVFHRRPFRNFRQGF